MFVSTNLNNYKHKVILSKYIYDYKIFEHIYDKITLHFN